MKKNLFSWLFVLAVLVLCVRLVPTKAQAASTSDLTFTLNEDGNSYRVTDCKESASGEMIIPATYNGKPVTIIWDSAFYDCDSLTSVTIPDSVTTIGAYAFYGCDNLEYHTYDNGKYLGNSNNPYVYLAKAKSTGITKCAIHADTKIIGNEAFYDCSSLTSVTIPNSVTTIGYIAFYGCKSLTSVTIPDSVTTIGSSVFAYCDSLTSVTIPDSVTTIGEYSFYSCTSLTSVTIPASVTTIGDQAFYNCKSLTSVTIPDSVTSIGTFAFENCSSLTNVTMGNSVKAIGYRAFYGCKSLTSVTIPDSVTTIGYNAFYNCPVKKLVIAEGSETVTSAIVICKGTLEEVIIPDSVTTIGNSAFYNCSRLTSVMIPDSITTIGNSAFYNCYRLTSVMIPDSVTTIGDYAFSGCTRMTGIWVDNNNPNYSSDDFGVLFNKDKTVLIAAPGGLSGSYQIPDSVTTIGDYAFSGCKSLTSVTIPDSVTTIGDRAFDDCDSLTSVTIGDSVTTIGEYAFYGCTSLTSVTIGDSVTTIGNSAFSGCDSLTSVTIGDSVTTIGDYAFYNCTSLTSVVLPESLTKIQYGAFCNCSYLAEVFYKGTEEGSWEITIDAENTRLFTANWHNESQEATFADQDCYYCAECDNYLLADGSHVKAKVVFQNWDGTVLSIEFYSYNNKVAIPADPTKAADNTYTYAFAGWDKAVVNCAGNAIYTATYTATYIDYTVKFLDEDGTVLSEKTYHWGDQVEMPVAPTKAADNTYTYAFAGWDKEVINCAGNVTYTAIYKATYIDYTVKFLDEDGTVLSEKTYHWGDQVEVPADPTKAADNTYTYAFAGWDKAVVNCAGNATYTATYTATYIDYTVKFLDEDGTIFSEKTYHWGDQVEIPADPTKAADNTYTYAFAGWDKAVVNCAGNATYTATYTPSYIDYTVVFKNWDGSVVSTHTYHYGDEVIAPADPTKAADNTYTYAFARWDKRVVKCAGDAVYTAVYTPISLYNYTVADNAITITKYLGNGGNVVIPDTIEGMPVAGIGEAAFSGCEGLTGVILPDTITTIGRGTFDNCPNLEFNAYDNGKYLGSSNNPYFALVAAKGTGILKCNIHADTKLIGDAAFESCVRMTAVTIPNGVIFIGNSAFSNCDSLSSVTIPDGVTTIGYNAFYNCPVKKLVIAEGSETVTSTMVICKNTLEEVFIPDGVTSIGDSAFRDCNRLTSMTIPDSVTTIGSTAFYYCGNLDSVSMGSGITSIGSSAFYGSSSLTNVYIKDIATWCEISFGDNYANPLHYASNLYLNGELVTELVIPQGVTAIGNYAFYDCDNITSVTISDSVTTIGGYAFAYCYRLTSVTIGDSVTTIGPSAFGYCSRLIGVVLPKSLTEIGYYGFYDCRNLADVFYKGTAEDSEEMTFRSDNMPLIRANWHYEVTDAVVNGVDCYYCPECDKYFLPNGQEILPRSSGDFNADDEVNNEDVIYLLWHTMFPESYPIEASADFTEDGTVNNEDVIYLLWHTMFPESYPLTKKKIL